MRQTLSSSLSGFASASTSQLTPSTSRLLSSTSSTAFLFRRPTGPSAPKLADELLLALRNDRLDQVRKLVPSLLTAVNSLPPDGPPPVSLDRLRAVMRFVGHAGSFPLLLKMFNALEPSFGYAPEAADHHLLLLGMARSGKLGKALAWIEAMPSTHGIKPTIVDWNVIFTGYRKAGDVAGLEFAWKRMLESDLHPNVVSYNIKLATLLEHELLLKVKTTMWQMEQDKVQPDLWTETALLTGFVDARDLVSARAVADRLRTVVDAWNPAQVKAKINSDNTKSKAADQAALNALLKFECAASGSLDTGLSLAQEFVERGHTLDQRTLNTLAVAGASKLQSADEAFELVELLEQTTGSEADRRTWTVVLKGVLAGPGGADEALRVHQEARDRSVLPDSQMIQPLLSELLQGEDAVQNMDKAKELYEDLATASKTHSVAPDRSIYNTLLRACADPSIRDMAFSTQLMADMHERKVKLEPQSVSWHIIALMRSAGSFEDAFKVYDSMRALDVAAIDHTAYNSILAAFISVEKDRPAPPPLVLEFLSDMRRANHPPSAITYALLLNYYSKTSSSPATIAQLHSLIKLDLNIDPDTALFNTLMSAYARVGAFNAAYRVWDTMRANPHGGAGIDDHSISIILDTCGFEGDDTGLERALRLWKELEYEGHVKNLKHYDSFMECLIRLGEMDRAEELALGRMSPQRAQAEAQGVVAGVSTLSTLLKLSRRYEGRWEKVRGRIESERPDLWPELKEVAKYQV